MIKNECDIIKDLLPSYVEGILSDNSKEFVDKHIKSCDNCKEILEMLKNGNTIEKAKKQAEDMAEIDYLKKYNKKMKALKIVAKVLVVFILAEWGILGGRIVHNKIEENENKIKAEREYNEKYEKGKYVKSILDPVYNKVCEIIDSKNCEFSCEAIINGKVIKNYKYLRKGDKTKIVYEDKVLGTPLTLPIVTNEELNLDYYKQEYGIEVNDVGFRRTIWKNLKTGKYYAGGGLSGVNDYSDFYSVLNFLDYYYGYHSFNEVDFADLIVRDDIYEEKECYVILSNYANREIEIWIDKASNLVIYEKCHNYDRYGDYINFDIEYKCTWNIGNVEDRDVMLPEYKGNRRRL